MQKKLNNYMGLSIFMVGFLIAVLGVIVKVASFDFGRYIVYLGFCVAFAGVIKYFMPNK